MTLIRAAQFDPETKRVTGFVTCPAHMIRGDFVEVPEGTSMTAPQDWIAENGELVSAPAPKTSQEVHAERDRRVLEGFVFQGKAYDCDITSQSNISGAATLAGFALGQGSFAGDYRWNGSDVDFSWLAADNTSMLMDAPTMFAMGQALAEHVRAHIFASRALKDADPIPLDFTDDKHWPTAY